jgi:uncharacterized protein with PIN domain
MATGERLLFKGDDFAQTDIKRRTMIEFAS